MVTQSDPRPPYHRRRAGLLSCVGLVVTAIQADAFCPILPPGPSSGSHDGDHASCPSSFNQRQARPRHHHYVFPTHVARVGDQARSSNENRPQPYDPPDQQDVTGLGGGVTASMFRERLAEDEEMRRRKDRAKTRDIMMQALEDDGHMEDLEFQDAIVEGYMLSRLEGEEEVEEEETPAPYTPIIPFSNETVDSLAAEKNKKKKGSGNWLSSIWNFVTGSKKGESPTKGKKMKKQKKKASTSVVSSPAIVTDVASSVSSIERSIVLDEGDKVGVKRVGKKGKKKKKKKRKKGDASKIKAKEGDGFSWWGLGSLFKKKESKPVEKEDKPMRTIKASPAPVRMLPKAKDEDEEREEEGNDFEFYGLSPVLTPIKETVIHVENATEIVTLLPAPQAVEGPEAKKDQGKEGGGGFDWWGIGSLFNRGSNTTEARATAKNVNVTSSKEGGGFDWWGLARNRDVNATLTNKTSPAAVSIKKEDKEGGGFDWWGIGSLFNRGGNTTTEAKKQVNMTLNGTRAEGGGFDWWGLFSRKDNGTLAKEVNTTINGTRSDGGGFDWWGLFGRKDNGTDTKPSQTAKNKEDKEGGGFDWWGIGSLFNRGNGTESKRSSWVAPEHESDYYYVDGKESSSFQRQASRFFDGIGRLFRPGGNTTAATDEPQGEGTNMKNATDSSAPSPLSPFAGYAPMLNMLRSAWEEQWGGGEQESIPGQKPRADDLVKLPRNMEEVLDLLADDTRYFFNSVANVFTPPTREEPINRRPVAKGSILPRPTVELPRVLEAPPLMASRFREDDEPSPLRKKDSWTERQQRWRAMEGSSSRTDSSSSYSIRAMRKRSSEPTAYSFDDVDDDMEEVRIGEEGTPVSSPLAGPIVTAEEAVSLPPPKPKESKRVVVASWISGVVESMKPADRELLLKRRRLLVERIPRKMDDRFLRTVSRKLQNDRLRIKDFQLQTDRFRNSLITGQAYYDSVLSLFGSLDDADEILLPLMDTLPEPAKRRELMEVYASRRRKGFEMAVERPSTTASNIMAAVGSVVTASSGAVASWAKSVVAAVAARSSSGKGVPPPPPQIQDIEAGDVEEEEGFWQDLQEEEEEEAVEEFLKPDRMKGEEIKEAIWKRVLGQEGLEEEEEQVETVVVAPVEVKPQLSPAERDAKKRQLLGERNIAYFNLRVDLYRKGSISAVDFYRSIKNFVPQGQSLNDMVDLLIEDDLLEDKRKARYIKEIHEANKEEAWVKS